MTNIVLIGKIVLALLKVIEIITSGIDRARWEQLGYDKATMASLAAIAKNVTVAKAATKEAHEKSDKDLDDILSR